MTLKPSLQTALNVVLGSLLLSSPVPAEQVIFNEIQYNAQAGQPEFIEIKNLTHTPHDIGTWYFSDGIDYTFPDFNPADTDAHILQPLEIILVSPVSSADLRAAYPGIPADVRIFGPYTGSLSNSGETLTLNNKNGTMMTTIDFNDGGKWPAAADGTGHTLSRINPNLSFREWRNWAASTTIGGTPGEENVIPTTSILEISEVHFGPDGNTDWIELHAPNNFAVSADAFKLSSTRDLSDAVSLSGSITGGGYLSFPAVFTPDENGDLDLFLSGGPTVLDAVRLDRDFEEESFQVVDGEFYGTSGHTQNAPNNPADRETGIVINEIMFDAPSDQRADEFIELYNRSGETIDLSGWKFSAGVSFDFPEGTTLAPGGYLVVAADTDCFSAAHPDVPALGNWRGRLRDRGELIRLVDEIGNMVDEVDYLPEGDWPNLADGDGSSMELRHPDMNNNDSTAWADSIESDKSEMETFTFTENFRRSPWLPLSGAQELHAHLVGDAHVIIENVSLKRNNAGSNIIQNGTVMSPDDGSEDGWVCQGTHWASFMDNGKLNLISDGHGDNKANRAEVDCGALVIGDPYTLTFDARWVSGKSRIIFQTLDHGFGTSFLLPIPKNLGTPGAPNSQLLTSPAPSVTGVIHSPAVPKSGDAVTVSAQIDSALTLDSVELAYRLDNSSGNGTWQRAAMTDDGTGLFSVTVDQFNADRNIIQFYVEANSGGNITTQPRYGANRPAMWIVDNRTMPNTLLQERFIVSEYDRRALTTSVGGTAAFDYNFPKTSNHFFNATFIANESEIYYNAEIRKSGSPFTRATNAAIDHGKWKLPGDRLFRNRRRSVIDASGTPQGSNTPRFYDDRIARYFLYQLGHPVNEMEFTHVVINTDAFRVRENHEPISNDFLNRNFEDGSDGTLLRIDDEWRVTNDRANTTTRPASRNADWSYKDTENPVAYHSEWLMRTRESDYDYGPFVELTRMLDTANPEERVLERLADSEMLALNAAVRGYDADWDTITVNRGKNAYLYRPKDGNGWMLIHWDGDRVFERVNQAILGSRAGVSRYFNRPFVRQKMNYYMTKLLNEHTKGSARTLAWMQAEADSVAGTGVVMPQNHYTTWFNNRENLARNFVGSSVNNTNFAITTRSSVTTQDILNLEGTSPPTVFKVRISGIKGLDFAWTSTREWELKGIPLKQGSNVLIVEGIDHDGNIMEQETFTIEKTNNGPPVVEIDASPKSLNISVGEELLLDVSDSFDPEGEILSFTWQSIPLTGSNITAEGSTATLTFDTPGFFLVTASTTDGAAQIGEKTIGVSVSQEGDFSNFGDDTLESVWTAFKADKHNNSPSTPYYSLQDNEGRLTISIPPSYVPLGLPPAQLPAAKNYVEISSTWKYDHSGDELTGLFAQPDYDDSEWLSGPGYFGFGESGIPAPGYQTSIPRVFFNAPITYYFRTKFEFNDDPIGAQLSIDHLVDDGVRYYLNGQVIGNVRLPDGVIDSDTVAEGLDPENIIEERVVVLDVSSALVQGTNVLAAEVHNESAGSSDLVFGSELNIAANPLGTPPPDLTATVHPWVQRAMPAGDWVLQTEVKLEKVQFGQFYAGLLVEANQNGNLFRYGVGFKDGTHLAAMKVSPSGAAETIVTGPEIDQDIATVRMERRGNALSFYHFTDGVFSEITQITIPEETTFTTGGVFAATETEQSLEASFDYAMLLRTTSGFSTWMAENGFTDSDAEYQNTGLSNILAYALGRDLNDLVQPTISNTDGVVTFTHRQRLAVQELNYRVELSTDLETWNPAGDLTPVGQPIPNPDGTYSVNLLSAIPAANIPHRYYRLVVTP
ncbi:MAG: lamin tail domain-containing protein [Akkermansiaceae bacterium]